MNSHLFDRFIEIYIFLLLYELVLSKVKKSYQELNFNAIFLFSLLIINLYIISQYYE